MKLFDIFDMFYIKMYLTIMVLCKKQRKAWEIVFWFLIGKICSIVPTHANSLNADNLQRASHDIGYILKGEWHVKNCPLNMKVNVHTMCICISCISYLLFGEAFLGVGMERTLHLCWQLLKIQSMCVPHIVSSYFSWGHFQSGSISVLSR